MKYTSINIMSFIFIWASLLGCVNENVIDEGENDLQEIHLSYRMASTRGSNLNEQNTTINSSQKVGVTIIGASATHNNQAWTTGPSGMLYNDTNNAVYYRSNSEAQIYAYHPYNSQWNDITGQSYTFTVSADQSGSGYANSDLLWAIGTSTRMNPKAELSFIHLLSKVIVKLTGLEGADVSGADIYVCGTKMGATFKQGTVTVKSGTEGDIKAGTSTSQATAIIIPQTIQQSAQIIRVDLNGYSYWLNMPKSVAHKAGCTYTYNLTVKPKQGVELTELHQFDTVLEDGNAVIFTPGMNL